MLYLADALVKERVARIIAATSDAPLSLDNTFMIGIDEFELLMQLVGRSEQTAEAVLKEKIRRQDAKDFSRGIEFGQIMKAMSIGDCDFLKEISPFPMGS